MFFLASLVPNLFVAMYYGESDKKAWENLIAEPKIHKNPLGFMAKFEGF